MKIYSVYDIKAAVYSLPVFMRNDDVAIRDFSSVVNEPGTAFNQHPSDYVIYRMGEFDENMGITTLSTPHPVCEAISVFKPSKQIDLDLDKFHDTRRLQPVNRHGGAQ